MSAGRDPKVDVQMIEQARKQINRLAEEIAHLSEQDLPPQDYYGEFLQRVLSAIAAPAGAVWLRTPQGNLQLQYQINLRQVGLDRTEEGRQKHDELLRQANLKGQSGFFPPQSGIGESDAGGPAAGNPTDFYILLAPIMVDKQVAGLVEVWQDPTRGPEAQRGFLHFLVRMTGLASSYTRNHQLRQMTGQQQVWTQLETFARQVHASLNPTEVAYQVANEGRRLVECDRISVALRRGTKTAVEAISGADVVERRSNLVQLMRKLFDSVVKWGEKLIYTGIKDDTLPPHVLKALDEYLAESNSKLLAILPLKDDREKDSKRPARSALMMESFEPTDAPEQLFARLEVVGRHATTALYNSVEHRRIPMRFIWGPLAQLQEGLGGKTRAIITAVGVGVAASIAVLIFVPGTLKVDAKGQLLPKKRRQVFSEHEGRVVDFKGNVKPGSYVAKGQDLVQMFDEGLGREINDLKAEIEDMRKKLENATAAELTAKRRQASAADLAQIIRDKGDADAAIQVRNSRLRSILARYNANVLKPGEFWVKAPMSGIVLTPDFRENWINRRAKPSEPLMLIGQASNRLSDWEIELKIPQKHIGQILAAFPAHQSRAELDVDVLLLSAPTHTYRGKLARFKVSPQADPNRDDNNEPEPAVVAWVRIDGEDIAKNGQLPVELLLKGTEVHAKVRCGQHALGYTLFYGVWEFIYEKVVFFF